jgi:aspartyl-tRNA(Asn)/glutamyl-tRNA(Gln) amidotransferase subunit C
MALTRERVEHVALLSRIGGMTQEQIKRTTHQLDDILRYVEKLNELDTTGVEPLLHPLSLTNVFREDTPSESLDRDESLRNAPRQRAGFFEVPRVIQ